MSGISHNQAIQLTNRRMDGLLNESQRLLLEEHLHSCDSCRDYANNMDGLSAHLQNEFHHRWDAKSGPSQKVSEHVMTKTRNIPMTNRISSSVQLLAGAMVLILLGIAINFVVSQLQSTSPVTNATKTVDTSPLPQDRLLAFTSDQNGDFDIYTMHTDGTDLTNLTNNPARDTNPNWSPDGKRIAFESNRDGFQQIYLMNADGSNVIQLTKDEADHVFAVDSFSPWSPDGSKLLIGEILQREANWKLYVLDANGGQKALLVDESDVSTISWSPDGQHIAFHVNDPQNPDRNRLYIVNADGSNLREFTAPIQQTEPLSFTMDYHWSPDGQSLFFVAFFQKTNHWTAYEARLVDDSLIEHATTKDLMYGWWNDIYMVNNSGSRERFEWVRPNGTSSKLNPEEKCRYVDLPHSGDTAKRSPIGNWVITGRCANGDTWLYWANSDGTQIKRLLDSPIPVTNTHLSPISWSPDDKFMVFAANGSDESDLYILDVSEALNDPSIQPVKISKSLSPSWQPVVAENIAREVPTPQSTSISSSRGLLAFTSDQNGNSDIYTMHDDGSGLANLTNNPAKDYSPNWSPDGTHIAFVSDRDGNDNIYIMNYDGTNLLQLTDDQASDSVPLWSPDGTKIAYMSGSFIKKNTNIHVVDLNGQNHRQLTNYAPGTGVMSHAWSPDSQYLLFDVNFRIARINANGGDITPITPPTKTITPYYVMSKDSSMLSYLTDCEDIKTFCYQLRLAYADATHQESSIGFNTLKTPELCEIKQTATWTGIFVQWSPDQSKILFAFTCEESGWFYISNADGSDFKPLTNYSILGNMPQNDVAMFDWSSDSQSIVFMAALDKPENESLYILNVDDALQNPELRPTRVNTSISQVMSPAWQPAP